MIDAVLKKINFTVPVLLSPSQVFKWFICIQFLIWTLVPCLTRYSLHHDVLEGITQGLQFQWGYSKHPFLSMWILAFVWELTGGHEWVIYALSQLVIGLGVFYSWKLNQRLLPTWHALIATLLLSTLIFYTIDANVLTPDSFQIPIWSAILYFYDCVITDQKIKDWIGLGFWMGLGLVVKYQVVILFLGLLLLTLIHAKRRVLFGHRGFLISLVVMMVVIAPNLYWLYPHWDVFAAYLHSEVHNYENLSLMNLMVQYFSNILSNVIIPVVVLMVAFPKRQQTMEVSAQKVWGIYGYTLNTMVITLLFLCCSLTPVFGRWLTPYFSVFGALLVYWWRPEVSESSFRRFLGLISISTMVMVIWISVPSLNKNTKCDAYYPNQDMSYFLAQTWDKTVHQPLKYLAGSRYLVASILPYMHPHPIPYFSLNKKTSPWIIESDVLKHGAVLVWDIENNYIWDLESMQFNVPGGYLLKYAMPIEFKTFYTKKGRAIKIAYSILRPHHD